MARLLIGNIKGPQGAQGPTGPQGPQGVQGNPGQGVPTGGSAGQYLIKQSATNYDADWGAITTDSAPTSGGTNPITSGGVYTEIGKLAAGMAILANGNTHAAIESGQFVYVRGHGTLADGMYKATTNIAANGVLSSSNLTAQPSGGMNALRSSVDELNSKTATKKVATGTTSFSALDGNSYASRALDRIHAQIDSLSSGIHQVESSGGPIYFVVLGKYQNSYYGGYLFTYGIDDTTLSYRFAYQNGTYAIYVVDQ